MTSMTVHPTLNRDREEIRVPSPYGHELLDYLAQRGLRGHLRTDRAGDVIALDGEPDMGRVKWLLNEWESRLTAAAV